MSIPIPPDELLEAVLTGASSASADADPRMASLRLGLRRILDDGRDDVVPFGLAERAIERVRLFQDARAASAVLDHALGLADSATNSPLADRLADRLHRLLDDGDDPRPAKDLVRRTIGRVQAASNRARQPIDLVLKPSWNWRDVSVAAAVFLVGILGTLPAILAAREQRNLLHCATNLQRVGIATILADQIRPAQSEFPSSSTWQPPVAGGRVARILNDGLLPTARVLDCPSNGADPGIRRVPDLDVLRQLFPDPPEGCLAWFNHDYAYALPPPPRAKVQPGPEDEIDPPVAATPASVVMPLVADRPATDRRGDILSAGNSPNHHGRGQNVCFQDGHVHFIRTRRVEPDNDIFLNRQGQPRRGVDEHDAVLVPGDFPVEFTSAGETY